MDIRKKLHDKLIKKRTQEAASKLVITYLKSENEELEAKAEAGCVKTAFQLGKHFFDKCYRPPKENEVEDLQMVATAIKWFEKVVSQPPEVSEEKNEHENNGLSEIEVARLCLFYAYVDLGEFKQATEVAGPLAENKDIPFVNHNVAMCHIHLGDYDAALKCLQTAIQENDAVSGTWHNFGVLLARKAKTPMDRKAIKSQIDEMKRKSAHEFGYDWSGEEHWDPLEHCASDQFWIKYVWIGEYTYPASLVGTLENKELEREQDRERAMQGDKDAAFRMATRDPDNVRKWLALASEMGHHEAKRALDLLEVADRSSVPAYPPAVVMAPLPPKKKKKKKKSKASAAAGAVSTGAALAFSEVNLHPVLEEVGTALEELEEQLREEQKTLEYLLSIDESAYKNKFIALHKEVLALEKPESEMKMEARSAKKRELLEQLTKLKEAIKEESRQSVGRVYNRARRLAGIEDKTDSSTEVLKSTAVKKVVSVPGKKGVYIQVGENPNQFFYYDRTDLEDKAKGTTKDKAAAEQVVAQIRDSVLRQPKIWPAGSGLFAGRWGLSQVDEEEKAKFPDGFKVRICADPRLTCALHVGSESEKSAGIKQVFLPGEFKVH